MKPLVAAAALLTAAACTYSQPDSPIDAIEVESARLEDFGLAGISMVGGVNGGSAMLVIEDIYGFEHELPLELSAQTVGLLGGMALTAPVAEVPLVLPPGEQLVGAELLGVYRGSQETLVAPVGAVVHALRNPFGVQLDAAMFAFGASFSVTFEWLSLMPAPEGDAGALEDGGAADAGPDRG